jgi:histidyl-tRNA synthetase
MTQKSHSIREFLPQEVWKWKLMEADFDRVLRLHDYQEVRLSILQDAEVIRNGITALMPDDDARQLVERTLHLCHTDGDLSLLSLRPEGTISVLHHTARNFQTGDIKRYYYHGPMFRKSSSGEAREFFQLGVELLGSDSLLSENEIISLGMRILCDLGLKEVSLRLNSFGCENCRPRFLDDVCSDLEKHENDYCQHCYSELRSNPFSETLCEDERCRHEVPKDIQIADYLCPKCISNFQRIKKIQANLGHPFKVDPHLFKNFAYYNETVFDFVINDQGKETVLGGGGRYDYLSARITGRRIPAVGFYLDLDEIYRLMDEQRRFMRVHKDFSVYICSQSPDMEMMTLQIAQELHTDSIKTVLSTDNQATETEKQNALKHRCDLMIIIREDNIREGKLLLHDIARDDSAYIPLNQVSASIEIARRRLNL